MRMTTANRLVADQSKSVTVRLQPRDQEHVAVIRGTERLTTTTEAIQRALEHYARTLKRRVNA